MDASLRRLTPAGPAGVCVLELRGRDARLALAGLGVERSPAPGGMALVRLRDLALGPGAGAGAAGQGQDLDEALLVAIGPEHFELHVHGSPPLVAELLAHLPRAEAVAKTQPSLERRALERLGAAPSELGARVLLDLSEGALRSEFQGLLGLDEPAGRRQAGILAERARCSEPLLRPTRVVLAGPANAGKSTLFNALVGEQRVLATPLAGTTRDAVLERAWLGPWPLDLFDTAGERDSGADALEAEGQAQGQALRRSADWVLRLAAYGAAAPEASDEPDLWTHGERPGAPAGALRLLQDPASARGQVRARFEQHLRLPAEPWVLGQGVPFEEEHRRGLAEFLSGAQTWDWLRKRLDLWLAAGP